MLRCVCTGRRHSELSLSKPICRLLFVYVSAGLLMIPPKISDSREVRREHEEGTRYRHQQGRFLQGLGQRQSAQAARHRQGPIFLEDRREEDQGSWRCLHSDRLKTPSFILH